jgi:hypothetical protein
MAAKSTVFYFFDFSSQTEQCNTPSVVKISVMYLVQGESYRIL